MPVKAALSEDEYLRTSFPGADRDFRDGEILERSMPGYGHSKAAMNLGGFFWRLKTVLPVFVAPELRLKLGPGRYRIPDVSVFWPDEPSQSVPDRAPLIAIEVLSPDDSFSEVAAKLAEYWNWGVRHVWLADPDARALYTFDGALRQVDRFDVSELGLTIGPPGIFD